MSLEDAREPGGGASFFQSEGLAEVSDTMTVLGLFQMPQLVQYAGTFQQAEMVVVLRGRASLCEGGRLTPPPRVRATLAAAGVSE